MAADSALIPIARRNSGSGLFTGSGRYARGAGATLREHVAALGRTAWSGLFTIFFVQAALTLGLVVMGPLLATWMNFDFNQFLMLRVGLVGVLLHGGMVLCCAVMLVADCNRHLMLLQGGFVISNLMMSILLHWLIGPSSYAILFPSLTVTPIALPAARHALHGYDYLTFPGDTHLSESPCHFPTAEAASGDMARSDCRDAASLAKWLTGQGAVDRDGCKDLADRSWCKKTGGRS